MFLKCTKETEGFTVGKLYKLQGCAGEYVQVRNDKQEEVILYEGYFDPVRKGAI